MPINEWNINMQVLALKLDVFGTIGFYVTCQKIFAVSIIEVVFPLVVSGKSEASEEWRKVVDW